jgi:hypothetical protein
MADVRGDGTDLFAVRPRLAHAVLRLAHLRGGDHSIALVIFRVFCTLRIFIRISLVPGIGVPSSERPVLLPVGDRVLERLLVVAGQLVFLVDALISAAYLSFT